MPPGSEYCLRNPSAGSGAAAPAAALAAGTASAACAAPPVGAVLVGFEPPPQAPYAVTITPHRIGLCFMLDSIPGIAVRPHVRRMAGALVRAIAEHHSLWNRHTTDYLNG